MKKAKEIQQGFGPMSRLFFLFETENINAPREIFYSFKPLITETTNMEMEREIYLVPILEYIC